MVQPIRPVSCWTRPRPYPTRDNLRRAYDQRDTSEVIKPGDIVFSALAQWGSCRFSRDSFLIFMPPQHTLQQCFYLFVQASVACHRYFFSLRKKTERISMKFARGYQYYQHINWLHFGRNWNRDKGLGYGKIFQSMSIGVAAMWNRCWRLTNEFTNFTEQTKADAIANMISR